MSIKVLTPEQEQILEEIELDKTNIIIALKQALEDEGMTYDEIKDIEVHYSSCTNYKIVVWLAKLNSNLFERFNKYLKRVGLDTLEVLDFETSIVWMSTDYTRVRLYTEIWV